METMQDPVLSMDLVLKQSLEEIHILVITHSSGLWWSEWSGQIPGPQIPLSISQILSMGSRDVYSPEPKEKTSGETNPM